MKERFVILLVIRMLYMDYLKNGTVNNSELLKDTIEMIETSLNADKMLGANKENNMVLLHYCKDMLAQTSLDRDILIQKLEVTINDVDLVGKVIKCFDKPEDPSATAKSLYFEIEAYTVDKVVEKLLNTASFTFSRRRDTIVDKKEFMNDISRTLEKYSRANSGANSAIVNRVDLGDREAVKDVYNSIANSYEEGDLLLTGWQYLNDLTAGGLRRGEFVTIASLQHKYKSGLSVSLFIQLAQFNKPILKDETKKATMVLFSLEDDVKNVFEFIFRYLKKDLEGISVDLGDFTIDEITDYVHGMFAKTGWILKIMRVDPTKWSYRGFMDEIEELERTGHEIVTCLVDYLGLVPTTGCLKDGPMGTDLRDMFRRIRNFLNAGRKMLFITPHQLSVGAKNLIRNGVSDIDFVKEVEGKGYYAGSGQLDQEIDLELYGHVAKVNGVSYLTIQRGKHRLPTTVSEEKKFFLLKFPENSPIPGDLHRVNTGLRKLEGTGDSLEDMMF